MRLLVLSTLLTVATCRQRRSIGPLPSIGSGLASIGSIFLPPTHAPHTKYPVYKVHKYTGIQLKPISHEELSALHPVEHVRHEHGYKEAEGHPPKVVDVIPEYYPSEPYSLDPYAPADRDTRAALAAIDSLGGLASFLPEGARGRSIDLEKSGEAAEGEAEDRIGLLRRKPLKLKKKGLLALLTLKGGPKGGLGLGGLGGFGGLGGLGGLGGISSGSQNNYESSAEELPYEGPYPGHTTVYRAPAHSPSSPGFLSGLSFGREHEGIPLELPEPSLPELPELKVVPEAPKLPQLTLPGNYKLPYSTGSYISIKVPKPYIPSPAPAPVYGVPAQEYGPPAIEYGPPSNEYGPPPVAYSPPPVAYSPPPVAYSPPPTEYAIHIPEYHTTTSYSYDIYNHGEPNQGLQETFVPSAPAPPVYNSYQNQVTSYQAPVHEYTHGVDTASVLPAYPPAVATTVYDHYPPAQGYSYLDNTHSPSEPKTSVVSAEPSNINTATNRNEENVDEKIITKQEAEEQQLPEAPKEQEPTNNS